MDTTVLIWIIIGVVVVAIIVGVIFFMRGRTEQRERAEHEKAEKLRAEARESELAAKEREARASQAQADAASAAAAAQQAQARAAQADLDAQRLADSVGEHEAEATKFRSAQEQTLRKADEVDPYVTAHDDVVTNDGTARPVTTDGTARPVTTDGTARPVNADGTVDDTPLEETPRTRSDRADRV